jgi:hypothetical protein
MTSHLKSQEPHEYTWRARIDGDDEYRWETSFYVAGPQHGPVVE